MDASINQIKELVSRIDEAQRMEVIKSLQRLIYSLETPQDTMYRYGHCVSVLRSGDVMFHD